MKVHVKVLGDSYIQLTLEESDTEITCGGDYAGKPEELVAMLAYAVKTVADDMHIEREAFIATLGDTIRLMDRKEIKK